jgi:hypothetical protein
MPRWNDDEQEWDESLASAGTLVELAVLGILLFAALVVCGGLCWGGLYFTGVWDG